MRNTKIIRAEEVLTRQLEDEEFRAEWERTALARAVALEVVKYRAEHGLSQAALARRLAVSQPVVARLELGEHAPTWETLNRLANEMGVHLVIDIDPSDGARLREVG
jgi:ribosome-binding protein aMBF1 (putative translation factor)